MYLPLFPYVSRQSLASEAPTPVDAVVPGGSMAASALQWCRELLAKATTYSHLCRDPRLDARYRSAMEEQGDYLKRFFVYSRGVAS